MVWNHLPDIIKEFSPVDGCKPNCDLHPTLYEYILNQTKNEINNGFDKI